MSTAASSSHNSTAPLRSTTDPSSTSSSTSPDYDRGFKAGVKSQESRMEAQKQRFRAQVDELKREVTKLRGRVEQMDGLGPLMSPTIERPQPRMGVVRRESIAEHENRIKNVERSFGI